MKELKIGERVTILLKFLKKKVVMIASLMERMTTAV